MTQEALKMALEALEEAWYHVGTFQPTEKAIDLYDEARTAIKEALAQTQEPVATDWERIARVQNAKLMAMCNEAGGFEKLCEVMDKYEKTTPPQRTWVGLTEDERDHLAGLHLYAVKGQVEAWIEGVDDFAQAIEAKLKELNT